MKIGLFLPNLGLPLEEALDTACEIGVDGIQLWNVGGELDPDNMTPEFRHSFVKKLESRKLTISALCGHQDFVDFNGSAERIAKFNKILDLSVEWGAPIVTTESGRLTSGMSGEEGWRNIVHAFTMMAHYGEKCGAYVAVEPSGACLVANETDALRLIEDVGSPNLKINLDPANLVMFGKNPINGVKKLGTHIVHTHAKDGWRRNGINEETPVGKGDVDWLAYLKALKEVNYQGFLCLEREKGPSPINDMKQGKEYLAALLAELK